MEVPIAFKDKPQLASFLSEFARRHDLYFRDDSEFQKDASQGAFTIWMILYRPLKDGKEWPEISAYSEGEHSPWVDSCKSPDPSDNTRADRTRVELLAKLRQKWPDALQVPMLPDGGFPLQRDVRKTTDGLKIDPARAAAYEIPSNSPLLDHE